MDNINQVDFALNMCIDNLNEWVCSSCATQGNTKPAAIFKLLRNKGYVFEETSPGRYDKKLFCPLCGKTHTHYKLLSSKPSIDGEVVDAVDQRQQTRAINLLNYVDAFTSWKAPNKPMVDSKTPLFRMEQEPDIATLTDDEVVNQYQLLSAEHIALKEKACRHCNKYGIRPPFMGTKFYYAGNDIYKGTCEGCGWYDGLKWTAELNRTIEDYNRLKEVESEYVSVTNMYKNYITYLTNMTGNKETK